jgi:hypothetical protein
VLPGGAAAMAGPAGRDSHHPALFEQMFEQCSE